MKRKKSHNAPLTDLQRLARKVEDYRLPSGPFNFATQAQVLNDAQKFFHEVVQGARRCYADPEADKVIEAARRLFYAAMEAAYPPDFEEDYRKLRQGDASGRETAIRFLEADPFFHRSGYVKALLVRALKPPMLTPSDQVRLQGVVLSLVDRRDDRDFRTFCKLARKVDGPGFKEQLMQRLENPDLDIRRRAGWVLDALAQKDSMERVRKKAKEPAATE